MRVRRTIPGSSRPRPGLREACRRPRAFVEEAEHFGLGDLVGSTSSSRLTEAASGFASGGFEECFELGFERVGPLPPSRLSFESLVQAWFATVSRLG